MISASIDTQDTPTLPTDPAGPTGRLASWLAGLRIDDIPPEVCERAKLLVLDGLGCAIVGAQLPWSRTAVDAVTRLEGTGDCTLIGWGRKISAPAAALLNGTFIQGFELDDYHPLAPLHSASLVLPSLLACAENASGASGSKFLLAAVAGFEVGPRVGLALHGAEMLSRGWHSGAVFGTHSAAAAAAKLLELDASRIEDALGLAGTQSCGLMAAQFEAMCKRMHHGFSARNGLYSAVLAAGGYTGIKRVFEREYGGFLSTFGEGHSPDASQIAADLGDRWETLRITIKPYAAMGGLHSPLDALFEIGAKRPLHADDIARIEVELSHAVYHHGWWEPERPLTTVGAQMNVGYALAVAVIDGAAMVHQFTPKRIDNDDVWALIPRIKVRHNEEFDRLGAAGRTQSRVRVTFNDGERLESYQEAARSMRQPLSSDQVVAKFRALTDSLIEPSRQTEIVRRVQSLDILPDIDELIELLAPPVGAAF